MLKNKRKLQSNGHQNEKKVKQEEEEKLKIVPYMPLRNDRVGHKVVTVEERYTFDSYTSAPNAVRWYTPTKEMLDLLASVSAIKSICTRNDLGELKIMDDTGWLHSYLAAPDRPKEKEKTDKKRELWDTDAETKIEGRHDVIEVEATDWSYSVFSVYILPTEKPDTLTFEGASLHWLDYEGFKETVEKKYKEMQREDKLWYYDCKEEKRWAEYSPLLQTLLDFCFEKERRAHLWLGLWNSKGEPDLTHFSRTHANNKTRIIQGHPLSTLTFGFCSLLSSPIRAKSCILEPNGEYSGWDIEEADSLIPSRAMIDEVNMGYPFSLRYWGRWLKKNNYCWYYRTVFDEWRLYPLAVQELLERVCQQGDVVQKVPLCLTYANKVTELWITDVVNGNGEERDLVNKTTRLIRQRDRPPSAYTGETLKLVNMGHSFLTEIGSGYTIHGGGPSFTPSYSLVCLLNAGYDGGGPRNHRLDYVYNHLAEKNQLWYWEDGNTWRAYQPALQSLLHYCFTQDVLCSKELLLVQLDQKQYEIDARKQRNLQTGHIRSIRCGAPPQPMLHLHSPDLDKANFPNYWTTDLGLDPTKQMGGKTVRLDPVKHKDIYNHACGLFQFAAQNSKTREADLLHIDALVSPYAWHRFIGEAQYGMKKQHTAFLTVYHGTKQEAVDGIVKHGFDISHASSGTDRCCFGRGIYMATYPDYCFDRERYMIPDGQNRTYLFMCLALDGERQKTDASTTALEQGKEVGCDDPTNPHVLLYMRNHLVYPEFLFTFQN